MTPAFPKLTLKLALIQNLVPSRFREELNVMANNQVSGWTAFVSGLAACGRRGKETHGAVTGLHDMARLLHSSKGIRVIRGEECEASLLLAQNTLV